MYILTCMYAFDICEAFEVHIFWFEKYSLLAKNLLDKGLVLIKLNNNQILVLQKYILFQTGTVYSIYLALHVSLREAGGGQRHQPHRGRRSVSGYN